VAFWIHRGYSGGELSVWDHESSFTAQTDGRKWGLSTSRDGRPGKARPRE